MFINVPIKDQRTETDAGGHVANNGPRDCVPTALAAIAQAMLGRFYSGATFKNIVYGAAYVGFTNPADYVGLMHSIGLEMAYVNDTPARLIAQAVAEIRAGHALLLAVPSDWDATAPASPFNHMIAGCDVPSAGVLEAMNPWGTRADGYTFAAYQIEQLARWIVLFTACAYKGMWIIRRSAAMAMVRNADGSAHDPVTGESMGSGIADLFFAAGLSGENIRLGEKVYAAQAATATQAADTFRTAASDSRVAFWSDRLSWGTLDYGGRVAADLFHAQAAANARAVSLQSQLDAANAEIARLKAQPAPVPVDPLATEALEAARAEKALWQKL